MFLLGAFYCVQMNPLCKLHIMEELSSRNGCIKQECGSIQRRSWSHSTYFVNEMSQISISTNVVSTKWYHLRINAIFCNRSQDLFKRWIDNVSFRAIWGLGSSARFSLKRQNVIFICIMKCKQTVYLQTKVEKIRIQTDCCNCFLLYN